MTFRLEDHRGDTFEVPIAEDCPLIKRLKLQNLASNPDALKISLREVFCPLVGNFDSEQGSLGGRYAIFHISSWATDEGSWAAIDTIQQP